jgi:hypothetical protein
MSRELPEMPSTRTITAWFFQDFGDDPNVVILDRFEDTTRRTTVQPKEPRSPASLRQPSNLEQPETEASIFKAANGGEDFTLL